MMDAQTKEVKYVNPAYETITGRTVASLYENPLSYLELIHSEDRDHILNKLEEAVSTGSFDEEFRIIRTDGELRWVSVKALLVRDSGQAGSWLIGTAQDVTARKHAEIESGAHLAAAEAARAGNERTSKIGARLVTKPRHGHRARHASCVPSGSCALYLGVCAARRGRHRALGRSVAPKNSVKRSIVTLTLEEQPFLQPIVREHKSLSVADTQTESSWRNHRAFVGIRSWLGVPLMASGEVLGVLSVGSSDAHKFTAEHFRLVKSLAIPAAVAIRNARLYERAEIYAAELQCRLQEIDDSANIASTPEARKSSRS